MFRRSTCLVISKHVEIIITESSASDEVASALCFQLEALINAAPLRQSRIGIAAAI
jgi:hypothetical protein